MKFRESETLEFKRTCVDDIRKEITAMCNCAGGTIYVGVEDDGYVIGLDDCDGTTPRIANGVRDAIKPYITGFIHYETLSIDGKTIVSVSVRVGAHRPYYLAEKGLRPEGVYVRQGASSVPVSNPVIRQIIKETDGDNYEDMRSLNQALALDEASKAFAAQKLDFGQEMQTLGQLLSEQFPDIIKAALQRYGSAVLSGSEGIYRFPLEAAEQNTCLCAIRPTPPFPTSAVRSIRIILILPCAKRC